MKKALLVLALVLFFAGTNTNNVVAQEYSDTTMQVILDFVSTGGVGNYPPEIYNKQYFWLEGYRVKAHIEPECSDCVKGFRLRRVVGSYYDDTNLYDGVGINLFSLDYLTEHSYESDKCYITDSTYILSYATYDTLLHINIYNDFDTAFFFYLDDDKVIKIAAYAVNKYGDTIYSDEDSVMIGPVGALPIVMTSDDFVYPTIVDDFVYLTSNYNSFAIANGQGQLMKEGVINDNKIDCSSLCRGFYILKLYNKNKVKYYKFIKN